MSAIVNPLDRIMARITSGEFTKSPKFAEAEVQRRFRAAIRETFGHSFVDEKTRNIFNKAWYEGKEDWVSLAQAYQRITESDAPETLQNGNMIAERIIRMADAFMNSDGFRQHPKEIRRRMFFEFVSDKVKELVSLKITRRQVVENVLSHFEEKYKVTLKEMITEDDDTDLDLDITDTGDDNSVDGQEDAQDSDTPPVNDEPQDSSSTEDAPVNPVDVVSFDVPLFIRILEWAKEEARTDVVIHRFATNVIRACENGDTLTMDNYEELLHGVRGNEIDYLRTLAGITSKKESKDQK